LHRWLYSLVLLVGLAACGDPLRGFDKVSDLDLANAEPARQIFPDASEFDETPVLAADEPQELASTPVPLASTSGDGAIEQPVATARGHRRSFFDFLKGNTAAVKTASLQPEGGFAAPNPEALVAPEKEQGLFGSSRSDQSVDIVVGAVLPFGEVGRACGMKPREMGEKVGREGRYTIYDSQPSSTQPRRWYVTGFSDGCARQVTAALAMFGSASMHEQLRYGRPSEAYPYSATDKAYEGVKSKVCRVGRQKPCGTRIKRLERTTVFVTTYERFTDNARWADILLHDGSVLASSFKAP